uniref:O-methyltransferase n=1 Tax=Sinopodophyllum hexandrum TaxID=93608 RepID=A0A0N9HT05_SINHE|nr:O-methyltransferase [Sinopodophyllum hexandrum]
MAPQRDAEVMNGDGQCGEELLAAPAHIWNHIFNFISSMSLKCAVQLNIPEIIHNHPQKPITLAQLVPALQIPETKSTYLYRLMRILVHSRFFGIERVQETVEEQVEEEGYVLTLPSKLLLKNHPVSMSPYLLGMLDPVMVTPWHFLSDWFKKTDELITPFEATQGMPFWKYFGDNPEIGKLFDKAMACDSKLVMSVVLKECKMKFEGIRSLVDVGGGTGAVAMALAETFPGVKCTVLDLPQVVGDLQGSKNLEFVCGDMFESIPSADVVLLKWILHNWSDEECVKILKRCREVIPSKEEGGKVIIIDIVVDDHNKGNYESKETQLFFDLLMMVFLTGRERTEIEWKKLFLDAGFTSYNISPIMELRSFIQVFP